MEEKIKPIYQELQGYLQQTPLPKVASDCLYESSYWDQINNVIDELNQVSGKDYSKFKIIPEDRYASASYVRVAFFRQKLGGLIDRLHAEYFSDEDRPFSGKPSTIVTQNQSQEQNVSITMVLQIQEKILEKLNDPNTTSEEKSFLERVKEGLGGVKSVFDLLNLIFSMANSMGISVERLKTLF